MNIKISVLIVLSFCIISLIVGSLGYYAATIKEKEMEIVFGERLQTLAIRIAGEAQQSVQAKLDHLSTYVTSKIILDSLISSNEEFDKMKDRDTFIKEQDLLWISVSPKKTTPLMEQVLSSKCSANLRRVQENYGKEKEYQTYSELILANKYGATAGATSRTTDYYQGDEVWFNEAKEKGTYFGDMSFDESSKSYAIVIAKRIEDYEGRFLGVLKASIDIRNTISYLKKSIESAETSEDIELEFMILDSEGNYIYSSENDAFLSKSHQIEQIKGDKGYFLQNSDVLFENEEMVAYKRADKLENIGNIGSYFIIESETNKFLQPVTSLKNTIMGLAFGLSIFSILFGLFVSATISIPIKKLRENIEEISKGKFTSEFNIVSEIEEINSLIESFDRIVKTMKLAISETGNKDYRKILEEKEEAKMLSNAYLNLANVFIVILDSTGKINAISEKGCKILERNKEEVLGKNWFDLAIPKEQRKNLKEVFNKIMAGSLKEVDEYKNEVISKSGNIRKIEWYNTYVKNKSGEITGTISFGIDITEKEETERKLKESRLKYETIITKTEHLIYDYDIKTGKIMWSGAITKNTGYSEYEMQNVDIRKWAALIHHDDRKKAVDFLNEATKSLKPYIIYYRFRKKDGSYALMRDEGAFIADNTGKAYRMFGTMKDVYLEKKETYKELSGNIGQWIHRHKETWEKG